VIAVELDRQIVDIGNHSSGTPAFDRARGWHGRRGDSECYLQPPRGSIGISQFIVGRGAFCGRAATPLGLVTATNGNGSRNYLLRNASARPSPEAAAILLVASAGQMFLEGVAKITR